MDKRNNNLPLWGNEKTMNMNSLILTNILSSHYFKINLYELKTYHEVIDEIYFKVNHLEPWEKGSRVTAGQTGMCGGVRGVGAGGIVSTAYCILYKLFTLKLTRKQVVGLINHIDSPYIRALGFMYIRYTQPPADLWDWYQPYLDDDEKLDVKAGGGKVMMIGEMLWHFLSKLEWFSTLFPRIPVPIQKDLERKMSDWKLQNKSNDQASRTNDDIYEEDQWKEEKSKLPHKNGRYKNDYIKSIKDRNDLEDEIIRKGHSSEDEIIRKAHSSHDRDRHARSKPRYSSQHSSRRSRSPFDSNTKKHHSHYKASDKSRHRRRDHSRESRMSRDRKHSQEHHSSIKSLDKRKNEHSHRRYH